MLQITQAQMDAFEEIQIKRLKDDLIVHFDKYFAEETQHFDGEQLSQFILDGIKEARSFGIEIEKQICVFLNIKVLLKVFEPYNQETHGWVIDILNNEEMGNPSARLNQLSDVVDSYLERLAGGG